MHTYTLVVSARSENFCMRAHILFVWKLFLNCVHTHYSQAVVEVTHTYSVCDGPLYLSHSDGPLYLSHECDDSCIWVTNVMIPASESRMWWFLHLSHECDDSCIWVTNVMISIFWIKNPELYAVQVWIRRTHAHTSHILIYIYIHICIYIHIYIHTPAHIYRLAVSCNLSLSIIDVYMYIYIYVCVCIYIYIYNIYLYVCVYI
jgi:hypothetical protein